MAIKRRGCCKSAFLPKTVMRTGCATGSSKLCLICEQVMFWSKLCLICEQVMFWSGHRKTLISMPVKCLVGGMLGGLLGFERFAVFGVL